MLNKVITLITALLILFAIATAYNVAKAEDTPWGKRDEAKQNQLTEEAYQAKRRAHISNELLEYAKEWCAEQGHPNDAVCIVSKWESEMGKRGYAVGGAQ